MMGASLAMSVATGGPNRIEHEQVEEAKAGDPIGVKVQDRCRDGDVVYKVT